MTRCSLARDPYQAASPWVDKHGQPPVLLLLPAHVVLSFTQLHGAYLFGSPGVRVEGRTICEKCFARIMLDDDEEAAH